VRRLELHILVIASSILIAITLLLSSFSAAFAQGPRASDMAGENQYVDEYANGCPQSDSSMSTVIGFFSGLMVAGLVYFLMWAKLQEKSEEITRLEGKLEVARRKRKTTET
jgi:hypothetical protein